MLATMRRYALLLGIFAMLATGLTAIIHQLTQPNIAKQYQQEQKQLLDQVIPSSLYDNLPQAECYVVTHRQLGSLLPHSVYLARKMGIPVAAAIESTAPEGYSGAIELLVAADFNGKVLGVRVLTHHETPGLGDKIDIRISNWIAHFRGSRVSGENDLRWRVKKEGGEFDQFTGATITPRAVIKQVQHTALFLKQYHAQITQWPTCGDPKWRK